MLIYYFPWQSTCLFSVMQMHGGLLKPFHKIFKTLRQSILLLSLSKSYLFFLNTNINLIMPVDLGQVATESISYQPELFLKVLSKSCLLFRSTELLAVVQVQII